MLRGKFVNLAIGALVLSLASCGGGNTPEPETPETPEGPAPAEPVAEAPPEPETPAEPAEPATPPEPTVETLNDTQIIAVTTAVNKAEVDQAKVAQKKGKHARVKKFAATMVSHHTAAQKKWDAAVKKLKIEPSDSKLLTDVKSSADSALEKLNSTAAGPEFDTAYMDAQVSAHQMVLDAIDKQLAPGIKDESLKKLLDDLRPTIEKHLAEAKEVQAALAAAPAPAAGASGGAAPTPKK